MRIMAVDFGDARTGVAVSDMTGTLVGDAFVLHSKNMRETAFMVAEEVIRREVSCIVIGYPRNMDGSSGERAKKSERFAQSLRVVLTDKSGNKQDGDSDQVMQAVEIKFWDERLTTMSANKILTSVGKHGKKRKQTVDAVAASLILEGYLAKRNAL